MEIRDRVAVVTGAASGIGRATALALARQGARAVLLADIDDRGLDEVAKAIHALGVEPRAVPCDLRVSRDLEVLLDRALDHFGQLDILHNNAGLSSGTPYWPDLQVHRIEAMVDVNLKAVLVGTRLAVERMGTRGGAIVNTASIAAVTPLPPEAVYCATKAGVEMFTRSCAPLGESHGIAVTCLCPGVVETPMLAKTGIGGEKADYLQPVYDAIVPLTPEEVAAAVLDLIANGAPGTVTHLPNQPRA